MSDFDEIRKRRRQQGQSAKERVLSGASSSRSPVAEVSEFDAVRNRTIKPDPVIPKAQIPNNTSEVLSSIGAGDVVFGKTAPKQTVAPSPVSQPVMPIQTPLTTKLFAGAGDKQALEDYKKLTGFDFDPRTADTRSEYQKEQEHIKNSDMPGIVKGIASVGNAITRGNPVGRFLSQATAVPGVSMGSNDSTGSNAADAVGGFLGRNVAPLLVPTGAPLGSGTMAAPYKAADQLMSTNLGQKVISKAGEGLSKIPKVSPAMGQDLAKVGLTEGLAGMLQNPAQALVNDPGRSGKELAVDAAIGGAAGLGLGVAFSAAGSGLSKLFKRNGIPDAEIQELLALPEGKGTTRMASAAERSVNPVGMDPVTNPYTFELPEASTPTKSRLTNASDGRAGLKEIDSAINDLNTKYEQKVIDEYKYLKQSLKDRGGVSQGNIQRDILSGDVVGRAGRQSNNPLWYQEFRQANGKVPSNKELYALARDRVDNGFVDEAGSVPSWKQENGYDETLAGYAAARDSLESGVRELDPAMQMVDQPIVSKELKDLRPKEVKKRPATQDVSVDVTAQPKVFDPYNPTGDDIPDFLKNRRSQDAPADVPGPIPVGEPILRPSQFEETSGLGITPFPKEVKPYDSLKADTRSQLVTRMEKEPVSMKGMGDRLYANLVDDLHPLNQFDKMVESVLDKPLNAASSTHKLALATRGADMTARQVITDKLVDASGKVVGDSLKDVLSLLPKGARSVSSSTKGQIRSSVSKHIYVDFEDYLLNKHAVTRATRGEKVFRDDLAWTPEFGTQKVSEYEAMFPEFKEVADKFYDFNRNMVNTWLVDTGMISPGMADAWLEANPFYVPNKRFFSKLEKGNGGISKAKKGFSNQSNPVKGYSETGSQRPIISPIEATIENVESFIKAAKRNQVMQQAVKNVETNPEFFEDVFEIVKKPERLEDLTKIDLDGDGLDELLSRFSEDFDKAMRRTALDRDNVVRVMMDGEQVHLKVNDPQLLEAITALGPKASNYVMDAAGWITNKMKTLTTGANPVFSLTRNLFRDIPHAYIASKTTNNPVRFIADMADGAMQILQDGDLYKQFKRVGGGHSSSIAANRNLLAQTKRSILPKGLLRDLGPRLFYGLENAMNAIETAPRLGEFKRAAKGGADVDLKNALFEAQDLTVNFKRRGKIVGELDKIFPYMNAAIQGIDQFARLYKNDPVKATLKAFLALSVPGAVLYAANYDNPDYKKLSNRVKDNYLLIPRGDGTFIKFAKPKELGTLFVDLPERLMRKFSEDDPAAFRDFADQLRTNFLPPGISGALKGGGLTDRLLGVAGDTIMGPVADLAANETFSGSPIVPGNLSRLSPGLQADTKTTNISRWIGEKTYGTPFEQSPKKLDYLARQYTGVLGQLGQPLLSPGGDLGSTLTQQMTADPVYSNDLSTEFYTYKDKLDQAYADRQLRDVPKWYSDPLRKQLGKINTAMGDVRKEIRAIQEDKSLKNKDKRDQLRTLQDRINELAAMGVQMSRDQVPYK